MKGAISLLATLCLCATPGVRAAQENSVSADVVITRPGVAKAAASAKKPREFGNVAVWLVPLDGPAQAIRAAGPSEKIPKLIQRNKTFEPHVLIVPVGTKVQFPNKDPFFHNIFSFYDGKRFDLGLYEAGSTRTVLFDRPGVSFLFCNIHAEMSAVVIAVDTPYFGLSNSSGSISIPDVPDGRYEMHVWYERSEPNSLNSSNRVVTITNTTRDLGTIQVQENPNFSSAHKNKYGLDYVPPPTTAYDTP